MSYDAILLVSFGGPEGPDDVMPFLENVTRGRGIPRERLLEVAGHYQRFGGVSPINAQCRELIAALRTELDQHGINLPIYWGNRNWHPLLPDTLREMRNAGVTSALAYVTSAFSSWSGCRQYRENLAAAAAEVGSDAPRIDKLRVFYNHPDFVAASTDRVRTALEQIPDSRRSAARLVFTAHSIPRAMADTCDYVTQLTETCRLIAAALDIDSDRWDLVYQSRSGRPQDPWLEPDIVDHLRALHRQGIQDVMVAPVGFLSDHMEILFDLDEEAAQVCREIGLHMVRAATVGSHPQFVVMLRKLIQERLSGAPRECVGRFGPGHDTCPVDCCPGIHRKARPSGA